MLHDDLYAGSRPTLTAEQTGTVTLLDARAPERFRGDVEPVDPVAGHIPGAENLPSTSVLADDGTFLENDALARLFDDQGARVGAYCGSGVSATVTVAALAALGREAALFPGSWSEWCSDPERPVERGARGLLNPRRHSADGGVFLSSYARQRIVARRWTKHIHLPFR